MGLFQLEPEEVVARIGSSDAPVHPPSLTNSLLVGSVGFTVVSLLGFAPWVLLGGWFYRNVGETGLYAVCALVYIVVAGPAMYRLIIGPGALVRFYKLFGLAFTAYAIGWIAGWLLFRGHVGSIVGLLAGTVAMGALLAWAFDARRRVLGVIAALFLLNAAGYFLGGVTDAWIRGLEGFPASRTVQVALAHTSWAVFYGLGLGAGLGLAFYLCQAPLRERLAEEGR